MKKKIDLPISSPENNYHIKNSSYFNKSYKIETCDWFNINVNKSILEDELNDYNKEKINKIINETVDSKDNLKNNCDNKYYFNNEIKIKKNNKIIFTNKYSFKPKQKKIFSKKLRSSRYRGVSKNGNKWQTIISFHQKMRYIGVYPTEEIAARIYDIASIKFNGIKARTNFIYNISQILKISETNFNFKDKNIYDIILNLIKES